MRIQLALAGFILSIAPFHAQTTPLTKAIRLENFEEAKKHSTPELVNQPDQGKYHPLTYAACTGNNELMEALLKAGADPNVVEHNGKTALYVAANLANVEGIKLLRQHGAKYPPDTARSPVAACVLSGSTECTKTLLEAYPDSDLDDGWGMETGFGLSRHPCAISYAAYHGYDEIALLLLGRNVGPAPADQEGRSALHDAAKNPRCSTELVEALVARGLEPVRCRPGIHVIPTSPLELGAAHGSVEKVKALTARCDPGADRTAINRAAHVAAAYGKAESCRYLFSLINREMQSSEEWAEEYLADLKKTGRGLSSLARPDSHTPIRLEELQQILPKAAGDPGKPAPAGTIAVISPDSLRNQASLFTQALSRNGNVTVLERDAVSEVIRESSLASLSSLDSAGLHKNLDLIPAAHVVLLAEKNIEKKSFVEISLINTRSGVVAARLACPDDHALQLEEVERMSSVLLAGSDVSPDSGGQAIAVSLTPVKPENPTVGNLETASLVNTALPYHVGNTRGCVQLTRSQLLHLETEKAIGVEGSYWAAAWVIDGGLTGAGNDEVTITLRAAERGGGRTLQAEKTAGADELPRAIEGAWNDLARQLQLTPTDSSLKGRAKEAELLAKYAKWLLEAGYSGEALDLVKAALVLGDRGQETLVVSLRAHLGSLPISRHECCGHINYQPEGLEPAVRFLLARRIGHYQEMCDVAIEYAETIRSAHSVRINFPNRYDILWVYDGHITQALHELQFFRRFMDHLMVRKAYEQEIRTLDMRIGKLTEIYLGKIRGKREELRSLIKLVQPGYDHNYYARNFPDLFKTIIGRITTTRGRGLPGQDAEIIADGLIRSRAGKDKVSEAWLGTLRELGNIKTPAAAPHLLRARYAVAESRPEKIEIIRGLAGMREKESIKSGSLRVEPDLTPEMLGLAGMESRVFRYPLLYESDRLPAGGIPGSLWESSGELAHTAEYLRNHGLYMWLNSVANMTDEQLRALLAKCLGRDAGRSEDQKFGQADWRCIRQLIEGKGSVENNVIALLDKLAPAGPGAAEAPARAELAMTSHIPLPPSSIKRGFGQFLFPFRAAIDGDELWIPAIYQDGKTADRVVENYHHVIHVISLESGGVRTVRLPDSLPYQSDFPPAGFREYDFWPQSGEHHRIILCKGEAYYLFSREVLLHIDRATLTAGKVELPLPWVKTVSARGGDGGVLASINARGGRRPTGGDAGKEVAFVVAIKGGKVTDTLVSSQRKPAVSPLDHPDFRVTHIFGGRDKVYFHGKFRSNLDKSNKFKLAGAHYAPGSGSWSEVSGKDGMKVLGEFVRSFAKNLREERTLQFDGTKYYLPFHTRFASSPQAARPVVMLTTSQQHAEAVKELDTMDAEMAGQLRMIPVTTPPMDVAMFNCPLYLKKLGRARDDGKTEEIHDPPYSYRGWWRSPNDLLEKRDFDVHVMARWNGNFIISLHSYFRAFPAVWVVPESAIKEHLDRVIEQGS